MCGIAGYSLSPRSRLERTLAARSLLAGIAERGADAVGYAYRSPGDAYSTVRKQRTPASMLLDRVSVPETAVELLVHVRDYTKGHPSVPANNHPVRHWLGTGRHELFFASTPQALAVVEQYTGVRLRKRELEQGTFLALRDARVACAARFRPDLSYRDPVALPAVRAPGERQTCLQRLAV